jgi:hypothetical protein
MSEAISVEMDTALSEQTDAVMWLDESNAAVDSGTEEVPLLPVDTPVSISTKRKEVRFTLPTIADGDAAVRIPFTTDTTNSDTSIHSKVPTIPQQTNCTNLSDHHLFDTLRANTPRLKSAMRAIVFGLGCGQASLMKWFMLTLLESTGDEKGPLSYDRMTTSVLLGVGLLILLLFLVGAVVSTSSEHRLLITHGYKLKQGAIVVYLLTHCTSTMIMVICLAGGESQLTGTMNIMSHGSSLLGVIFTLCVIVLICTTSSSQEMCMSSRLMLVSVTANFAWICQYLMAMYNFNPVVYFVLYVTISVVNLCFVEYTCQKPCKNKNRITELYRRTSLSGNNAAFSI